MPLICFSYGECPVLKFSVFFLELLYSLFPIGVAMEVNYYRVFRDYRLFRCSYYYFWTRVYFSSVLESSVNLIKIYSLFTVVGKVCPRLISWIPRGSASGLKRKVWKLKVFIKLKIYSLPFDTSTRHSLLKLLNTICPKYKKWHTDDTDWTDFTQILTKLLTYLLKKSVLIPFYIYWNKKHMICHFDEGEITLDTHVMWFFVPQNDKWLIQ
jgi:hypothetical protein